ncbi:MAG TPA: hypothetical protein VM536_16590 [Chloroflexia bacterium]|nr:hypothetical protein [Chloroflexia bacterium]
MRIARLLVPCVLLMIALATPAAPLAAAPLDSPTRVTQATLNQYLAWMREARVLYPYAQPVEKMYRVMMCESSGDPRAAGGGGRWLGLFQYVPGTWRGSWNPYRASSIYDAKAQIFATAKAWSIGMQSHWSCFRLTR